MIVFGSAVTDRAEFESVALPGINRAAGSNPVVLTRYGHDSIQEPYNEILDEAAGYEGLEALVLLHQDLELLDDSLPRRVRSLLDEPRVGVIGGYGGRRVPLHFWTETDDQFGRAAAATVDIRHSYGSHEVEVVDGSLLVLMPWVVRTLRFSEALAADFHGYDVDLCMRVRAAGGRVVCDDIPFCHRMRRPWTDPVAFQRAGWAVARMWDPALRPPEWAAAFKR
jgi:hypothetical protein